MICQNCNNAWESQLPMRFCPFCGTAIPTEKKKIETISDAIEQIVSERGLGVLGTPKQLYGLVLDLVSGCDREKGLLRVVVNNAAAVSEITAICKEQDTAQVELRIAKLRQKLAYDAYLAEEYVDQILTQIFAGLHIEYGTTTPKKVDTASAEELFQKGKSYAEVHDYDEAVRYYRLAADQGHAEAQCNLGLCYEYGTGVKKQRSEAVKWYRLAADQGNATAQCFLGNCYYFGYGVAKDLVEAVKWYRLAAEQGYAPAQNNLGLCYEYGHGVAKDTAEAEKWYRLAMAQGVKTAKKALGRLGLK